MLAMRSLVLSLVIAAVATAGAMAEERTAPLSVSIATHSHLNDATALANKNNVMSGQNVAVTRSNIRAQQDDVIAMASDQKEQTTMTGRAASDDEQPNDAPAGLVLTGDRDKLKAETEADDDENTTEKDKDTDELTYGGDEPPSDLTLTGEKDMLTSPDASEGDAKEGEHELEHFIGYRRRFFFPGFRRGYYGWRYPLPYWRRFGPRFYGRRCPFGRIYGNFYYC